MGVLWGYCGGIVGVLWGIVGVLWGYCGGIVGVLWGYCGGIVGYCGGIASVYVRDIHKDALPYGAGYLMEGQGQQYNFVW